MCDLKNKENGKKNGKTYVENKNEGENILYPDLYFPKVRHEKMNILSVGSIHHQNEH